MAPNHKWGSVSLSRRATLHPDLQRWVDELLHRSPLDLTIVEGHRDRAGQTAARERGVSRASWGQSPHNRLPSYAVDVAPLQSGRVPWDDRETWDALGALGEQVAKDLGLSITWGGRFRSFYDGPHFELQGWQSVKVPG